MAANIPEIWETVNDKVLSIKGLKEKYTKYCRAHAELAVLEQSI